MWCLENNIKFLDGSIPVLSKLCLWHACIVTWLCRLKLLVILRQSWLCLENILLYREFAGLCTASTWQTFSRSCSDSRSRRYVYWLSMCSIMCHSRGRARYVCNCHSMPHHQHKRVWARHACPAAATLASSPPTCSVQDWRAGLQGTAQPLACIRGGRLPTGHRRLHSSGLMQRPTHILSIAHSLLTDLDYRTVCQPSCESQMLHSDNFDGQSKCIYLVSDSCSAEWQCFSCAVYKLTYLLVKCVRMA